MLTDDLIKTLKAEIAEKRAVLADGAGNGITANPHTAWCAFQHTLGVRYGLERALEIVEELLAEDDKRRNSL